MPRSSLPVLLYHYISRQNNAIAVHPDIFAAQLAAMRRAGYVGVSLDEARDYLLHGRSRVAKPVLITFDDGYLDNATYAWPLLERHGHKAVIFAVSERMESGDSMRPTWADVWAGRVDAMALPEVDDPFIQDEHGLRVRADSFLNWEEARRLEASGTVRIAAHSTNHVSVFSGPQFKGLYKPAKRSRSFDAVDAPVVWGLPRFALGPALATRAFTPSEEVYALARRRVPQEPMAAKAFLEDQASRDALIREMEAIPVQERGRLESEDEYADRVRKDLSACRDVLSQELGREPDALAWPWGASTPLARSIARELDFTLLFDTRIGANRPGAGGERICRFKVRNRGGAWLLSRLAIHSRAPLAAAYAALRRQPE